MKQVMIFKAIQSPLSPISVQAKLNKVYCKPIKIINYLILTKKSKNGHNGQSILPSNNTM